MASPGMLRFGALQYDRDGEPWSPAEDALLGTNTDRAIGEMLRRSSVAVSNRRTKLGIVRRRNSAAVEPVPADGAHMVPLEDRIEAAHLRFWNTAVALRSALDRARFIQMTLSHGRVRAPLSTPALQTPLESVAAS